MTVQELQEQIKRLTDAEFQQLSSWVVTEEKDRRAAQPAIEQAKQEAESETATKIAQQLAEEHPELVEKPTEKDNGAVRVWEPWHPLKASTHYRYGDKTKHGGKVWRDVLDPTGDTLNVWEPGAQGIDERYWVEEVESETSETPETSGESETSETNAGDAGAQDDEIDEFKQPSGSHDSYAKGAKVRFQGKVYESTIPNNAYSPAAYPQGWKEIG